MKLKLYISCYTDGDFSFNNIDNLFDVNNSLYKGAIISYTHLVDGEQIFFDLTCEGEPNPCRWAARDLMETLVCNIHTHKYYLVKDLYDLIITPKEELLWSGRDVQYSDILSGNYDGTVLFLDIRN